MGDDRARLTNLDPTVAITPRWRNGARDPDYHECRLSALLLSVYVRWLRHSVCLSMRRNPPIDLRVQSRNRQRPLREQHLMILTRVESRAQGILCLVSRSLVLEPINRIRFRSAHGFLHHCAPKIERRPYSLHFKSLNVSDWPILTRSRHC
jgi:hypothetical protein